MMSERWRLFLRIWEFLMFIAIIAVYMFRGGK